MQRGGVCPVCEIPHEATDGKAPVEAVSTASTPLGRLWQSGRLSLFVSLLSFALATVLPLAYVRALSGAGTRMALTPLELIQGITIVLGPQRIPDFKSMVIVSVPAAALAMASFLWSRRTGSVMRASRPLVFVVAVLPGVAAALPLMKLGSVFVLTYALGPAAWLVGLGVAAGLVGAVQFGNGVPEEAPRSVAARDDDDED